MPVALTERQVAVLRSKRREVYWCNKMVAEGKTYLNKYTATAVALEVPESRTIIITTPQVLRAKYVGCADSIQNMISSLAGECFHYQTGMQRLALSNGSRIDFISATDDESIIEKLRGARAALIIVDFNRLVTQDLMFHLECALDEDIEVRSEFWVDRLPRIQITS